MTYIFLANGFEEIEALTAADLLRRAGVDLKLVSAGKGNEPVCGSHKIKVLCDISENDISPDDNLEMIVLPGGTEGVNNLSKSKKVNEFISFAVKNKKCVAAICAAPTILSDLGYLDGVKAVCYPSMLDKLSKSIVTGEKVVRDGIFITAEAAGSSEQFALALIEILKGKAAAEKVRAQIYAR